MRRSRSLLLATALPAVALLGALAVAAPAAAATSLGVSDLGCAAVRVSGTGLPAATPLLLDLVDPVHNRTLARQAVRTGSDGSLDVRVDLALSGTADLRAQVSRPGSGTSLAWAEHAVPRACPLAYTGAAGTTSMIGLGLASLVLGFLLLTGSSYRGRHLHAYRGRHLAVG